METDISVLKWGKQLNTDTLLFGARKRRAACRKLAENGTAQVVPLLASALASPDEEVRSIAEEGLRNLKDPLAVETLALAPLFTNAELVNDILEELGHNVTDVAALGEDEPSQAEAAWRIENPKDGTVLALIPEGKFLAGEENLRVHLPPYYLALTRVTNAQYVSFLNDREASPSEMSEWIRLDSSSPIRPKNGGYVVDPQADDFPVVQVSWEGAMAYCRWADLRLPTELEWEKGARGVDGRQYPWGNEWETGRPRPTDGKRHPEEIGSVRDHPQARSPYGLYQMIGGVYEWCADWYDEDAYKRYAEGDLTPPVNGENRVLRGGEWRFGTPAFIRQEYRKSTVWRAGTLLCGFRCAKSL